MKPITAIALGLLFLSFKLVAQKNDSVRISTIPHQLFWENSPEKFSTDNNKLVITAGPKTDMFRDPNVAYNTDNAPKLLFKADNNFVLTAAIEHSFTSKWDGGAIVIKQDSLNWIKFCFEKDYTGRRRVVSVVTKNISDKTIIDQDIEIPTDHESTKPRVRIIVPPDEDDAPGSSSDPTSPHEQGRVGIADPRRSSHRHARIRM